MQIKSSGGPPWQRRRRLHRFMAGGSAAAIHGVSSGFRVRADRTIRPRRHARYRDRPRPPRAAGPPDPGRPPPRPAYQAPSSAPGAVKHAGPSSTGPSSAAPTQSGTLTPSGAVPGASPALAALAAGRRGRRGAAALAATAAPTGDTARRRHEPGDGADHRTGHRRRLLPAPERGGHQLGLGRAGRLQVRRHQDDRGQLLRQPVCRQRHRLRHVRRAVRHRLPLRDSRRHHRRCPGAVRAEVLEVPVRRPGAAADAGHRVRPVREHRPHQRVLRAERRRDADLDLVVRLHRALRDRAVPHHLHHGELVGHLHGLEHASAPAPDVGGGLRHQQPADAGLWAGRYVLQYSSAGTVSGSACGGTDPAT